MVGPLRQNASSSARAPATAAERRHNPLAMAEKMGENLHRNENDSRFDQTDNACLTTSGKAPE
jgi:hypothetical protein